MPSKMNWTPVSEWCPASGQEVLAYFNDTPYDIDQYCMVTYFRKGDILHGEMPYNERVALSKTINNPVNRLLTAMFADRERPAPEDGFYIYDVGPDGYGEWRRHADIITHWMPLTAPGKG